MKHLALFALSVSCALIGALAAPPTVHAAPKAVYAVEPGEGAVARVLRFDRTVNAMAASPDGKLLAAGSAGKLLLVAFADGALQRQVDLGHGAIRGLAFNADGSLLAVAAVGQVALVEVATGRVRWKVPGHPAKDLGQGYRTQGGANGAAFVGATVVTIESREPTLRAWATKDGAAGATMALGLDRPERVAASPDGTRLLVADGRAEFVLLDAAGKSLRRWQEDGLSPGFAFSPDGKHVALSRGAGGASGVIRGVDSGEQVASLPAAGNGSLRGLAWSPDGKRVVSAATRGGVATVILWTLGGEDPTRQVLDKKYTAEEDVDRGAVIGAGGTMAAVCGGRTIQLYPLR